MSVSHSNTVIFFVCAYTPGQETQIGCSLQAGPQLRYDITLKPKNININSLQNRISDRSAFMRNVPSNYFVVSQTKLSNNFTSAQYMLSDYDVKDEKRYG